MGNGPRLQYGLSIVLVLIFKLNYTQEKLLLKLFKSYEFVLRFILLKFERQFRFILKFHE